jgi:peptidoglycan hydrolase-like protein with peptidoglycan-binding domain
MTRSRLLAGIVVLAAAAVVVIVVWPSGSSSPSGSDSGSRTSGSATVNRRNLVETDTESGTLTYAHPRTVYDRLSGTVTWLPKVGEVIEPGHTLFKVDNNSAILLDGPTPAYRDLKSSDSAGPDIKELNRNLVELGYNPDGIVVDDDWQWATTAGVEEVQKALDLSQTGSLSLGTVVFLPGRQLINTVDATAGSGVGSGGSSGSGGGAPTAVLQTSSTRLVATVDLPASSQSEAVVGEHVTVEMPNSSTVGGRITAVSRIAQSPSSSGSSSGSGSGSSGSGSGSGWGSGDTPSGSSTIPVTVSLDKRVSGAGWDQAAVSVNFAQAKAKHVLSVPVTALIATSGNEYAVQEAAAPHKLLPVHTGLFAAGYVQISGPGIHAGLRVTDSQA